MLYLFKKKKNTISAMIFGACFTGINLMGKCLENSLTIEGKQYLGIGLAAILGSLLIGEIYLRMENLIAQKGMKRSEHWIKNDKVYFLICTAVLCAAYLPVFLAYYPGLFAYDVDTQIPQYVTGYSKHHNLIHTLYLHFFYYFIGEKVFGSYTVGIAWASVVQMILFSVMISYVHLFLRRRNVSCKIRMTLVALSALLPFFSVLSVSMTKDVLFSGFVGLLCVCLYYWENQESAYKKPGNLLLYIFSIIGTILFRNNGIYAVLFSFLTGTVFIGIRKKNIRYLASTIVGIAAALMISNGMAGALSASNGSANEMFSIPYQQIAHVYETENAQLTQDEKEEILNLIPDVEKYDPHISDPIKANATGAYQKKELLSCYIKLFFKYPVHYVEAFVMNNSGYLYIGDTSHSEIYGATLSERSGYLLTDTKEGFGVEHKTYFAALETIYERLFSVNEYLNNIVLAAVCSPAVYFWLVILLAFFAFDLRKPCIIQFAFLAGLMLTMMAGPCALIRYALPYIICLPVLTVAVSGRQKE